MPREPERFGLDVPFEEAMQTLLGVDTDGDGDVDEDDDPTQ